MRRGVKASRESRSTAILPGPFPYGPMTRPSHWLLISLAAFATVVTATGSWRRVLAGPRVDHWVDQRESTARLAVERGRPVDLFGVVLDRHGRPVAGAQVALVQAGTEAASGKPAKGEAGLAQAETDVDGRFALTARGRRSHQVRVVGDGFADSGEHVVVPGSPLFVVLEDERPFSAKPAEAAAASAEGDRPRSLLFGEGFVRAPQGERLGFTQVAVCETGATVVVNEHGLFQIPLPTDGVVSLVASDEDGRVARTKSFRPSRRSGKVPVADLVLEPGLSMRGYVRDEQGRPADGAIVIARQGKVEWAAIADLRGEYWIEGLCADVPYDIEVLPHRGRLARAERVTLERDLDRDLFLATTADRRFRVLSQGGDVTAPRELAPLGEAHVVARNGRAVAYAQADDEGWVTLTGIAPAGGRAPITFEVRTSELEPRAIVRVDDRDVIVQ